MRFCIKIAHSFKMIGHSISHYRIVSQLGVGGMGIVYEGVDPRLGRPVALKFVPEELSHDLHAMERLRAEARTASGLNHPNICTIYDVGEHEGRPFIVMELLKGQTLRERIAQRLLRVHEAVDIGIQVADALDCAHGRHVIHRDIKPANLFMVDRGQVKILDFGLAKLLSRDVGTQLTLAPTIDQTAAGVALGTVAYMSPEQVQGETLDGRTDLFSLGVVLYECVTGHQPFKGKTSAVVFASILTQAPTAPVVLNPDVPVRLQDVINNCLEKDRELRYQEAASLRADLKRVKRDLESGASGVTTRASVVVSGSAASPSDGVGVSGGTVTRTESMTAREASAGRVGRTGVMVGAGVAVIGVALTLVLSRGRGEPAAAPAAVISSNVASANVPVASPAEPSVALAGASLRAKNYRAAIEHADAALQVAPERPDAQQIREEARAALARFDAAVTEANRLLAEGDTAGATRALGVARDIDPAAPQVADLSSRLVDHFRTQADAVRRVAPQSPRQTSNEPARAQPATNAVPAGGIRQTQGVPEPSESQTVAVVSPVPAAPAAVRPPPVEAPPAAPAPSRAEPATERRPGAAEDDETAIRRIVATYARAIETKDVALFRTVKPNLSADEQRRIEAGFRAVSSQRVAIAIQSIERQGEDALVRLRRQDTIQAGGRQQTADSQQTMTLTHSAGGWVIREIGR